MSWYLSVHFSPPHVISQVCYCNYLGIGIRIVKTVPNHFLFRLLLRHSEYSNQMATTKWKSNHAAKMCSIILTALSISHSLNENPQLLLPFHKTIFFLCSSSTELVSPSRSYLLLLCLLTPLPLLGDTPLSPHFKSPFSLFLQEVNHFLDGLSS